MKHLWVVNHYAMLQDKDGSRGRHEALALALVPEGWSTAIVAASTSHPEGSQGIPGRKRRRRISTPGVDRFILWAPAYYSNGIRRVINMVWFTVNLLLPSAMRGAHKPDVILGSTVHLLAAWAAAVLARRHKVPFAFEIRDVWPETLIDLGKLDPRSPVAGLMKRVAMSLCKRADLVVSPLPGIRSYLDENGFEAKPFVWISNGAGFHQSVTTSSPLDDTHFTFMYLGSHGNANALDTLLDAFDLAYQRSGDLLRLRLVGSGPLKSSLMKKAMSLTSASAITFEEKVPREQVIPLAQEATALVATMGDYPVYRFGISLNKLFDYLQSGRPIVFSSNAPNDPVQDAGAGFTIEAGDPGKLSDAMVSMASTTAEEREQMGARGVQHVVEHYSYAALARQLASALDDLVQSDQVELK